MDLSREIDRPTKLTGSTEVVIVYVFDNSADTNESKSVPLVPVSRISSRCLVRISCSLQRVSVKTSLSDISLLKPILNNTADKC